LTRIVWTHLQTDTRRTCINKNVKPHSRTRWKDAAQVSRLALNTDFPFAPALNCFHSWTTSVGPLSFLHPSKLHVHYLLNCYLRRANMN